MYSSFLCVLPGSHLQSRWTGVQNLPRDSRYQILLAYEGTWTHDLTVQNPNALTTWSTNGPSYNNSHPLLRTVWYAQTGHWIYPIQYAYQVSVPFMWPDMQTRYVLWVKVR